MAKSPNKNTTKPQGMIFRNDIPEVSDSQISFREYQCKFLKSLLRSTLTGSPQFPAPQIPLFVCGPRGCGKTTIVKHVALQSKIPFVYVDCLILDTEQLITSSIVATLAKLSDAAAVPSNITCKKLIDLNRIFSVLFPADSKKNSFELILILDGIENLNLRKSADVIFEILQFQKSSDLKIKLIFTSRASWQSAVGFNRLIGDCVEIFLPAYTKKELMDLVSMIFLSDEDSAFIRTFSELIVNQFHPITQDIRELRAYAQRYYPAYVTPVIEKGVEKSQTEKLWRNILPNLTTDLQVFVEKRLL